MTSQQGGDGDRVTGAAGPERKLAAILATRLVGFNELSSTDQERARKYVRQVHRFLHTRASKNGGEVVKEWSGLSVSYFDSPVKAMRCALEMRRDMQQVEGADFRIGIHVGELVIEGDEVLGEGANIAFGLSDTAPKRGISLSERVWEDIRSNPDFPVKSAGKRKLDNVSKPVQAYNYKDPTEPGKMEPALRALRRYAPFVVMLGVAVVYALILLQRWANLDEITWPGTDTLREMGINPLFVPALITTVVLYLLGIATARLTESKGFRILGVLVGAALALPGIFDVLYYLHIFDNMPWYYEYRMLHWSELAAGGMGFLPGFLMKYTRYGIERASVFVSLLLLILAVGVLSGPYLQSVIHPLNAEDVGNEWSGGACQATVPSSSGPCAVATFLRDAGVRGANEKTMVQAMYTNGKGTDPWHMGRALQKEDFDVRFVFMDHVNRLELPTPALAEVQMLEYEYKKQWITILAEIRGGYIFGDPIKGYQRMNESEIMRVYKFTGFFLEIEEEPLEETEQ